MRKSRARRTVLLLGLLAFAAPVARSAPDPAPEFRAFLTPPQNQLAIGAAVDIQFQVDASARHFNAYALTIAYDADIVAFEGPVVQGPLMTGACGQTIFFLTTTDSSVTYSHSLLCSGLAIDGPGVLSSYRFRALSNGTSPLEIVSNPNCTFVDAGVCINPNHPTFPRQVILTGAEIQVGPPIGVPEETAPVAATTLIPCAPNPMQWGTRLRFVLATGGSAELSILDVAGRVRWQHFWPYLTPGLHETSWAGADVGGNQLAAGTYFSRLTTASGVASMQKLTIAR